MAHNIKQGHITTAFKMGSNQSYSKLWKSEQTPDTNHTAVTCHLQHFNKSKQSKTHKNIQVETTTCCKKTIIQKHPDILRKSGIRFQEVMKRSKKMVEGLYGTIWMVAIIGWAMNPARKKSIKSLFPTVQLRLRCKWVILQENDLRHRTNFSVTKEKEDI